jgi:hypothetical protein
MMSKVLVPARRAIDLANEHTAGWYAKRRAGKIKTGPNGAAPAEEIARLHDEEQQQLEHALSDLAARRTELDAFVVAATPNAKEKSAA